HIQRRRFDKGREGLQILVPCQDHQAVDLSLELRTVPNILKLGTDQHAEVEPSVPVYHRTALTSLQDPPVQPQQFLFFCRRWLALALPDEDRRREAESIVGERQNNFVDDIVPTCDVAV